MVVAEFASNRYTSDSPPITTTRLLPDTTKPPAPTVVPQMKKRQAGDKTLTIGDSFLLLPLLKPHRALLCLTREPPHAGHPCIRMALHSE